jgi:hypothetical protein
MIFIVLLSGHLGAAIRAGHIDAALAGNVRNFLSAFRTDAVSARTGAGFVAAPLAAPAALSAPLTTSLAASAALVSVISESIAHKPCYHIISLGIVRGRDGPFTG